MKTLLVATSVALLATVYSMTARGQAPPSRGTSQIGYVSAQRILTESTDGKAGVARLQEQQQQQAAALRPKQQTLDGTRQQLVQSSEGSVRAQLLQQEVQQRTDLEKATAQAQTELQTLQRQLQTELQARLKSVIDDVLKDQNIQVVLNSDVAIVWAAPSLDLTSVVIERLNVKAAAASPRR